MWILTHNEIVCDGRKFRKYVLQTTSYKIDVPNSISYLKWTLMFEVVYMYLGVASRIDIKKAHVQKSVDYVLKIW